VDWSGPEVAMATHLRFALICYDGNVRSDAAAAVTIKNDASVNGFTPVGEI
jgi:hypothetical protein